MHRNLEKKKWEESGNRSRR